MLRLQTFGTLRFAHLTAVTARLDRQRRRVALMAVVAATGPVGIERERLLDLFWPESDPERARNALKQATFALRRDLEQDPFAALPGRLALDPAVVSCDAYDAVVAMSARDDATIAQLVVAPWLDDVALADTAPLAQWIDDRRRMFTDEVIRVHARAADAAFTSGDPAAAADAYRAALRWDPYRVAFVSGAMKSLAAMGDVVAALQTMTDYEERLARELQVAPDASLVHLSRQLRARVSTAARAAATPNQETPAAWTPPPFPAPRAAPPAPSTPTGQHGAKVVSSGAWRAQRVARRGIFTGAVIAVAGLLAAAVMALRARP